MFRFRLTEAKEDIQKFVDKFGQDTYDEFKKSSQRLKNNNMSTDIYTYINDDTMDKKKLDTILFNLKQKVSAKDNDLTKIQGKYEYIGQGNGYKVYKPLDAVASMNLGVGTGWCTTGRYGHYGDDNFKPSLADAKRHFNDYTENGFEFYYFLDEKTMKGLYAVAYSPSSGYYEIFDAEDETVPRVPNIPKLKGLPENLFSDFVIEGGVLKKYSGTGGDVVIPNGVTSIDNYAFVDCEYVSNITIPDSVKEIGDSAFERCTNLTSITIPDSVTRIGDSAFEGCTNLTSVTIPDGVTDIGDGMFCGCTKLTNVMIPDIVDYISNGAFYHCTSLTNITIPNSVTYIGGGAFYHCTSLTNITIPNSVTYIGNWAFKGCENLTLQVYAGSYAEEYAKEKEIPYKIIDGIKENFTFKLVERFTDNRRNNKKQPDDIDIFEEFISNRRSTGRKLPDIEYADLLTKEEAEKLPNSLRRCGKWGDEWWLCTPSADFTELVGYVVFDGFVDSGGCRVGIVSNLVRPALRLTNLNDYKVGEDFKFGGQWFRIIDEHTALCLDDIGQHRFDKESNNYETSEIKRYIDNWFNKSKEGIR